MRYLTSFLVFLFIVTTGLCTEKDHTAAIPRAKAPFRSWSGCFVKNLGQFDESVRFVYRLDAVDVGILSNELVLRTREDSPCTPIHSKRDFSLLHSNHDFFPPSFQTRIHDVKLRFEGSAASAVTEGFDELPCRFNFFLGNDASRWRTNVPAFRGVRCLGLYPGVELWIHEKEGSLEYDLLVDRCDRLSQIVIRCEGTDSIEIDKNGDLILASPLGIVRQHIPAAWKIDSLGAKVPVESRFRIIDSNHLGFRTIGTEADTPLVIDPTLTYSSYLGGRGRDLAMDIAQDPTGAFYTTGWTNSVDFPITPDAYDLTLNGNLDVFIAKFDSTGRSLLYATYVGGSNIDCVERFAQDSRGNLVLAGETCSFNFPTTPDTFQPVFHGGVRDLFVLKLNAQGDALMFSSFLGGKDDELIEDFTLGSDGCALVSGSTESADFPITPQAYDKTFAGLHCDGFITKFTADGKQLKFSTYLGGSGFTEFWSERVMCMTLDAEGGVWIGGFTDSPSFPTTPDAFDRTYSGGYSDGFVARLDASGAKLEYSTFIGGSSTDVCDKVILDTSGNAVTLHSTVSTDFPTTVGAFDTVHDGTWDCAVLKLGLTDGQLAYSTFLGGEADDIARDMYLDGQDRPVVVGETESWSFPSTLNAFQSTFVGLGGISDGFITRLESDGAAISYSSFLGGTSYDSIQRIVPVSEDRVYLAGYTFSGDFPVTKDAFDSGYNGGQEDGVLIRFDMRPASVIHYSKGYPGTGGWIPSLSLDGYPGTGEDVEVRIEQGLGNASGYLIFGFNGRAFIQFRGGHLLVQPPFFTVLPVILSGPSGSPGIGGLSVPITIPGDPGLIGLFVDIQALLLDQGASQGVSMSAGLEVEIG
jgi:hypothetical protein